jgi:hypothetical protein
MAQTPQYLLPKQRRARYERVKRINHQKAYSFDGACANQAGEIFSRLRRAEIGIHHHIAGAYLLRYAQESSWREDNRRVSNGDQVSRITSLALKRGKPETSPAIGRDMFPLPNDRRWSALPASLCETALR